MSSRPQQASPESAEDLALVSVIIRTCDRPDFLQRALASLQAQHHGNLEAVVVNDGAQAVAGVCDPFREHFALRVVSPAETGNRVRAANLGLETATGDYLIFLDDDDWFLPDHLEKLVAALEGNADAGAAYTGVDCVQLNTATGAFDTTHAYNQPFDRANLLLRNFIPMHAAMFRRSFVDEGLRLDESLSHYEDWDFWLQLNNLTDFVYVPGVSACYYLGDNSGFGLENSPVQVSREDRFFRKWRELWTAADVRDIIEYARQVPDFRQKAHEIGLELNASQQELTALTQRLYEERDQHQAQARRLAADIQDLQRRCSALAAQKQDLESDLAHLRHDFDRVINSRSWKITAPLRRLNAMLGDADQVEAHAAAADTREEPTDGIRPLELITVEPDQLEQAAARVQLPAAENPAVSVVIPAYNHIELTLACLLSISAHPPARTFEVIVVDDASTDATQALLPTVANLVYLRQETNSGFVPTCNLGAEKARGDYLLFLNNDTQVTDQWLDALADTLDDDPRAGIAGSMLVYPSGHLQEAGASLHRDGTTTLFGLNQDPGASRYNVPREVDHCSGAALMIRRALFQELGGFDTRYAPAYFEDADLSMRVRGQDLKVVYQPRSRVVHHLSVTTDELPAGKMAQIEKNRALFLDRWATTLAEEDKVRLIAFYLPQYHPIPENDAWWGKGFTEWTKVAAAQPLFKGHYQPHRPTDLGYYDLRVEQVRIEQARLAREYGVYGFCYYYYWFSGKRLLERPLLDMLASGKPDFPFCLCWANENWTRRWDGKDAEILIAQDYTEQDAVDFIDDLLPVFRDARYIRVHGRPLLLIYRADQIPRLAETVEVWRRKAEEAGLGGLFLAAVASFHGVAGDDRHLFDAVVEFPPHNGVEETSEKPDGLSPDFTGKLYDYQALADTFMAREPAAGLTFRGATPAWDNTARRGQDATVFLGANPQRYGRWLKSIVDETRNLRRGDDRLVFVNAWNEWAEGNHLEPDGKDGHAWLEATRDALGPMGCYDAVDD